MTALPAEFAPLTEGRLLVVPFAQPHRALSWAVSGGGFRRVRTVVWRQVGDAELARGIDPERLLAAALAPFPDPIGLLTARDIHRFDDVTLGEGNLTARCVATVGLGNALAIGDPPGPLRQVGTINLLCQLSRPLSDGALVEAISLATEARTAAMLAAHVPSRRSTGWATGTGTDCIIVATPEGVGAGERYAGKHTSLGALIGQSVGAAVSRGIARWQAEQQ